MGDQVGSVRVPYEANVLSAVTIVVSSMRPWEIKRRSNGSRWCSGKRAVSTTCDSAMDNSVSPEASSCVVPGESARGNLDTELPGAREADEDLVVGVFDGFACGVTQTLRLCLRDDDEPGELPELSLPTPRRRHRHQARERFAV